MTVAILSLVVLSFAISCPLTWFCRGLGHRLGQLDAPGDRKIHTAPIPATGGIAIFWAIVTPMLLGLGAAAVLPESFWQKLIPELVPHLPGIKSQTPLALGIVGCLAALHFMGLIDDRKGMGPWTKLVIQLGAAAVLAIFFEVRLLELLDDYVPGASIVVTVLWFVVITNAFNFLDNMDGLSGGLAVICGGIFLATALINGQWFVAAPMALLIGAQLGFLVFNFPPASIFMGDGGSLVTGFLMAFGAVRVTYYGGGADVGWWAVLTPMVVLAIPLYDITSVTLIRISQGKSPLVGDTQHFSHRLVRKGLSRPAAVGLVWACALATGVGGVVLGSLAEWQAILVIVQTAAVLLVLALLERTDNTSQDI
ncbi:MAG: MraY family glycosyltransferase [Planctomycetota bacterium]|jgi:UDP-GlcNAc:undecaprenyl-phosphate GlcNAc-1-phosphate transferase